MSKLSHIDERNQPTMVDVSDKKATDRDAHARTVVRLPDAVIAELLLGEQQLSEQRPNGGGMVRVEQLETVG